MKTFRKYAKILTLAALAAQFFAHSSLCDIKISSSLNPSEVKASQESELKVNFSIPDGLHIYSNKAQKNGVPTRLKLSLPEGFSVISESWPTPKNFEYLGEKFAGYGEDFSVAFRLKAPALVAADSEEKISILAEWLACGKLCVPGSGESSAKIKKIASASEVSSSENNALGKSKKIEGFWSFLFGAFLGGVILNLMPCVFPVIGLKIFSFAESAESGSRGKSLMSAAAYSLGIILSFAALGGIIIAARSAGESLGWGFQLQNPFFTALMSMLFFAMALSFAGVFEIGAFAASLGRRDFQKKEISESENFKTKALASFGSGIFATLVASPCTAPFMGAAVGAALAFGGVFALLIFMSMGLGMAFPYLVLSAFPSLVKILPRPGKWMEIFKQILSIPLFASAIWLCAVFAVQTSRESLIWILCAFLILSIGLRIFGIFNTPYYKKNIRLFALFCVIISIFAAIFTVKFASNLKVEISESTAREGAWSLERQESLRSEGRAVYVNFTAAWCLTCQFNKRVFLDPKVIRAFDENNIAFLEGDWTNKNSDIAQELEKFGRAGVPLNLLYSPDSGRPPEILPAILSADAVLEAIDKMKK